MASLVTSGLFNSSNKSKLCDICPTPWHTTHGDSEDPSDMTVNHSDIDTHMYVLGGLPNGQHL